EIIWQAIHINEWHLKFRRQHPISNYIADFYCHSLKLIIEIDGDIHEQEEIKLLDREREENLKELGLTILRFKNEEVFNGLKSILIKIGETIKKLQSTPSVDGGKQALTIVKIGGNIIDDEAKLSSFLKGFAAIHSPLQGNSAKILVHGGGKLAT